MIHKKANFENTKGIMVCEMGEGDVCMVSSKKGDYGQTVLAFKSVPGPRPINIVEKSHYKSFDEMKPELVFIFSKVESIDALINMLIDCKKEMI